MMSDRNLIIPKNYKPSLGILETEIAIKLIKDTFERELASELNLTRVSAPLFVSPQSGLNDNLSGVERPVSFDVPSMGEDVEIVHSLAKWKRLALHRYSVERGRGIYADMNAIRRDEDLDNIHSIYVDQWDWEIVISENDRNLRFLKDIVTGIFSALKRTGNALYTAFPQIPPFDSDDIAFITTQELEDLYPSLSSREREDEIAKKHGTVFIMQIGGKLNSGYPHDSRAPDYDDWSLNGDIIAWNPILNRAFELSSMGIRVDSAALKKQLDLSGCTERSSLPFHKMLLEGKLPLTAGGGIGQSRMCMLLLQTAHIGEVQASVWPKSMIAECEEAGIHLL